MAETPEAWKQIIDDAGSVERSIKRSAAVNVNAKELRSAARKLALAYFQGGRNALKEAGLSEDSLASLDREFQDLLRLTTGGNAKASYLRSLRSLRTLAPDVEVELVVRFRGPSPSDEFVLTAQEASILQTLERLVPTAGLSYRQALADLQQEQRHSWRGTASELRETVRETLDHLAPDGDVKAVKGFAFEGGRSVPTMAQKVRFIFRSRDVPSGAMAAPENTVQAIDAVIGSLARSTYDRGSLDTHVAASRQEVRQLKRYVDTVLCDVLRIA